MTQRIPWRRVLAEGAIIVVSILLAFGIQAWWDHRQEARDETVVLAALLDEFQAKMDQLEMRRTFHTSLLESCRKLIRASISEDESLTPEDVDRLLADLWWYNPQGEWESAILGALYDGGNLTVISDPELRINRGDATGPDIEHPRENECDGRPEEKQEEDQAHGPLRQEQRWLQQVSDLYGGVAPCRI
ncbi:MAG: hypothetical protein ACYTFO_07725 [Planctomycetota bacterium]|jgi:hypothetical protein